MKSLFQYITEKQGYIDYEDFVEELTNTIEKDTSSRLQGIEDIILSHTLSHISDEDMEMCNRSMFQAIRIMNIYEGSLRHCLQESGVLDLEYVFTSDVNHNPFWLDRLIVKVTDQLPEQAVAALDTDRCIFNNQKREAVLHIRPIDDIDILLHDYCLPKFNMFVRIYNRNITKEKLKEFIQEITTGLFSQEGLVDKERMKKNIIHEISHTFDLYLAQIKDVQYLKNALGDGYIQFRSDNDIFSCFIAAGYMINKSEINARRQELIYWTKNNTDKKDEFNKIYTFLNRLQEVRNINDCQEVIREIQDIYDKVPPIDNLLYILLRLVQGRHMINQEKDVKELVLALHKSKIFNNTIGFNKEIRDKNELLKQTDKLIELYIKQITKMLDVAVKHLIK